MSKKSLVILAGLGLILLLAACGKSTQEATAQQASTPGMPTFDASTMTEDEKLAIGTLQLEGTDLAVDKEEAQILLPLWKAARALKMDETVSEQEMEALYQQIRKTMSAQQVQAIDGMTFTSEDINALMANLGVGFGSSDAAASNQRSSGNSQMPSGGGFPDGGGGPSGGGAPPGGGPSISFRAGGDLPEGGGAMFEGMPGAEGDQSSGGTGQSASSRMTNMFIEPLIRILRDRLSS